MGKFRYVFSKKFIDELDKFEVCHINDHRTIFNEAWTLWLHSDPVCEMVKNEVNIMQCMGYTGDIIDKMYHHARFALRKKNARMMKKELNDENKKKEKCKEKIPVGSQKKEMIKNIICHIKSILEKDLSPGNAFTDFYNNHFINNDDCNIEYLKKSYKNKYYVLSNV